jgi:aspartate kinase
MTNPNASHTVDKIGGTSMSQVDAVMDNILIGRRAGAELYNRVFVVSAYGGMTDKLLEHKKSQRPGVYALFADGENDWAWGDALSRVGEDMRALNAEIMNDPSDRQLADRFVDERIEGTRSCLMDLHRLCSFGHFKLEENLLTVREMLSAIGEAHSAHNTMLLLRRQGVDAVFVDLSGWREQEKKTLDERIRDAFADIDLSSQLPIVTGYAQADQGLMGIYGRGYSEVTFSRIACLTGAREAIIHKEFHLSSADPKIVGADNVRTIGATNYDVADQLSNMGMEAIHPRAAKGLRQNGIPLRIANTFEPDDKGTVISEDVRCEPPRAEIVTGQPALYELEVFDQDMVGIPGAEESVVHVLKRFKIHTVTKAINANTMTHYVTAPLKQVRRAIEVIRKDHPDAQIQTRKVAVVSVIGSNLPAEKFFARATAALDEAGIEVIGAHVPSRGVDMQFVIQDGVYDDAVRALHDALIGEDSKVESLSGAAA